MESGPARYATTAVSAATALSLQLAANVFLPFGYQVLDVVLLLTALVCWTWAAHTHLRRVRVAIQLQLAPLAVATLMLVAAMGWSAGHPPPVASAARRTLSFYSVLVARSFFDRDGDGKSAILGGSDCDDNDERARPLSLRGTDCLGWIPAPATRPGPLPPLVPPSGKGPQIVLLVTVDSFRCGLGQREQPPLRDACPHLTALAMNGRSRLDVRTASHTALALRGMFERNEVAPVTGLPEMLRAAGFQTHAVVTVAAAGRGTPIGRRFDSVDDTLVPAAGTSASTVAAGTDRLLARLGEIEREPQPRRHFLWLHHYDPHTPYVEEGGDLLAIRPMRSYLAEIRRTDEQLLRVRRALERSPLADRMLLLVTADHGEDMGELGHEFHGHSLRETSVRVPFIAWSPGKEPTRFIPAELPASPVDLAPFLLEVVGGPRFTASREVTFASGRKDPQIGIHVDGWKLIRHLERDYTELYDLTSDPDETRDLSVERPDQVQALGRRLGRRILADHTLYQLVESY